MRAFSKERKRAVHYPERTNKLSVFLFVGRKPRGAWECSRMTLQSVGEVGRKRMGVGKADPLPEDFGFKSVI